MKYALYAKCGASYAFALIREIFEISNRARIRRVPDRSAAQFGT
jgi:hypothetical protein